MIYDKLLSRKNRIKLKICALTVIFSFSLMLYSCETVTEKSYKTEEFEKLENPNDGKIIEVKTADSIYNSGRYNMEYISNKETELSCFRLAKMDTVIIKNSANKMYKVIKTLSELKTEEVNRVKIEYTEIDAGKTALYVGGIVAITAVIALIIAILTSKKKTITLDGWNEITLWK